MADTKEAECLQEDNLPVVSTEPSEGLVLEADYAEDRPISLLAERQREFQRAIQGHYVYAQMPQI